MKKNGVRLAAAIIVAGALLALSNCFYMPGVSSGKARAGLVLPRYLIANPVSLALIVGGPGMEPMFVSYTTIPESITIDVPSGLARTFTVLLNGQSATLQGQATVDLQPGETKNITVTPTVAGTQIVAPDSFIGRLVQIADMSGSGWKSTPLSWISYPYDVDFDDQGRIYVAYANYAGGPGILRMNDIMDTSPIPLAGVSGSSMRSTAMDLTRGLLYYTDGNNLWRMQVTPTQGPEEAVLWNTIPVPPSGTLYPSYIAGIAVDSDGYVYIANSSSSSPASTILKINPNPASAPTLIATSRFAFSNPWDVLVNGDYVYVSDYTAKQIVRLDKNLAFVDSLAGYGADSFLGPERFVAVLNKPIAVIDEPSNGGNNRLISFDDMTGTGWATYGSGTGSSQGQFTFFNC